MDALSGPSDPVERVSSDDPPRAREVLDRLIDPRLLATIERWERVRMVRPPQLALRVRLPKLHVDPATWGAGFLAISEREIPAQLSADLRVVTPQALLRDLHRPVRPLTGVHLEPLVEPLDPGGRRAMAAAREARRAPQLPRIQPSAVAVQERQAERRALLREPWQPHLPDEAPRPEVFVAREPSLLY